MTSYLIIGDGRVARHFKHYFGLEGLRFCGWSRKESESELPSKVRSSRHVLLLISDSAIDDFYLRHERILKEKVCVHVSGSLVSPWVPSAHPLMTFSDELYDLTTYRKIPFIIEKDRVDGEILLPGLKNPTYSIAPELKSLYHSLCVLSGNFTVLLWEKVFSEFENTLGLPREAARPYLDQIAKNLQNSSPHKSVLTGPLVRRDRATIERNIAALNNDPYAEVYRSFVHAFETSRSSGDSK